VNRLLWITFRLKAEGEDETGGWETTQQGTRVFPVDIISVVISVRTRWAKKLF
jgi:hypothetical protein